MKKRTGMRAAATLVGLACAGVVMADQAAQQEPRMPAERVRPATCTDIEWHPDLRANHPGLIGACQEAVVAGGQTWARFAANFTALRPDGEVVFTIRDRQRTPSGTGGIAGEVVIAPAPGQMAYINERRTPFTELHPGQQVNLYVPEGHYGFATLPGAPMTQVAEVSEPDGAQASVAQTDTRTQTTQRTQTTAMSAAQREPQPVLARLPATAGPLPWLAVGGALSLLGGLGVSLRRRIGKD